MSELPLRFEYRAPSPEQTTVIQQFREHCKDLATFIDLNIPAGRERSLAITNLEQVSMWGNKAIVFAVESPVRRPESFNES